MDYKKYIGAEWKDKQRDGIYLHAFNGKDVKMRDVPTLLIGIGGTGIESVLTLKRKVESNYHPENAAKLEYLLIDTDILAEEENVNKEDTIIIQSADTAMLLHERKSNSGLMPKEIKSWLDPEISPFKVMNGAAGIRQAGRLILFLNAQKVYAALAKKIKKISIGYDLSKTRIDVYIFTGIGGGTGSGMFVDISYLVRYICSNTELHGIIFMPDVSCMKPGLRDVTKSNIRRNGFAALKEIEHLMMLDRYHDLFVQEYPGNIGVIQTMTPIFDYCILVGAQEKGRKKIATEKEIYQKVAEYMLTELQPNYKDNFSVNSFKSNLVFGAAATESYFEKYVAIGAASKYIAVDYYYSCWLHDVISRLMKNAQDHPKLDLGKENFFKLASSNMKKQVKEAYKNNKKGLIFSGKAREQTIGVIEDEWKKTLERDVESSKKIFQNEEKLEEKLIVFSKNGSIKTDVKVFLNNNIPKVSKIRVWKWVTKGIKDRLYESYIEVFLDVYGPVFDDLQDNLCEFAVLLQEINRKCDEYTKLETDDSFLFSQDYFEKIRETDAYKKSITEAADKLVADFKANKKRWLGRTSLNERFIWLSDYVAEILHDSFEKSGCQSIFDLLEEKQDGNQMKVVHIEEIINQLDQTSQLWPTVATETKEHNMYEALLIPDREDLMNISRRWSEKTNSQVAVFRNKIQERFSKILFVTGYAMWTFEGLKRWEEDYIRAQNKIGLHLYATSDKNWNELPSPYFETVWSMGDEVVRKEEKARNDKYRETFDKALDKGYIFFDVAKKMYGFCVDENDNVVTLTDANKECFVLFIGDIESDETEEYTRLAKDMFVHMFTYREKIRKAVEKN